MKPVQWQYFHITITTSWSFSKSNLTQKAVPDLNWTHFLLGELLAKALSFTYPDINWLHYARNPPFTFVFNPLNAGQCCPHIETMQLICVANQLTAFYEGSTGI